MGLLAPVWGSCGKSPTLSILSCSILSLRGRYTTGHFSPLKKRGAAGAIQDSRDHRGNLASPCVHQA